MSELIKRVAQALAKEEGYAYDPLPYDARARAAIEALLEAGYVVVQSSILEDVLEAAESYDDEGPPGEGWQSDGLESACKAIRAALKAE